MARNYNDSVLVSVEIQGFDFKYGFLTRTKESTRTDLGHTRVNGTSVNKLAIGVNTPKPPRASKRTETGIESSFIDKSKIQEAKGKGYQVGKGRFRPARDTKFTVVRYITINGVKYAWNSPRTDREPAELGTTGVRLGEGESGLVFGADFPKPPRGSIEIEGGSRYSTFIDPDELQRAIDAGWFPSDQGDYTLDQLKARLQG